MSHEAEAKTPRARKITLAVSAFVVTLASAEVGWRVCVESDPIVPVIAGIEFTTDDSRGATAPFRSHPSRLFEPYPNLRGLLTTDAMSLRGGAHPETHPNLLRVVVVGDSVTMGYGVHYGDSFVAKLETRLRRDLPSLDVDVVAVSCVGYSTWQNRLDLDERGLPFRPDIVILAMTGWNDASPAVLFADEEWSRRYQADRAFESTLFGGSRIARALRGALLGPSNSAVERARGLVLTAGAAAAERVPLERTGANVRSMIDAATRAGATPLVVLLPHRESARVSSGATARLEALCESGPGPVDRLDLRAVFRASEPPPFFDDIHPDESGHARIAEAIAIEMLDAPLLALRERERRSREPRAGGRVQITEALPRTIPALEPNTLLVRGTWPRGEVRFFLDGTPLHLEEELDDGSCRLRTPPLRTGELVLEVSTRAGSARFPEPITTRGATLHALAKGRIKATIRGPRGARVELVAGTRLEPTGLTFARRREIDQDSVLDWSANGAIGADGTFVVETPRMPDVDTDFIYLQAILEFEAGDPPYVPAYTNVVSIAAR